MSDLPVGKITPDIFAELIYPALGYRSNDVIVGPQNGVDIAITRVGNKVMATTTDPVFIVKEYGFEKAAWFAIHILVSDVVTSGLLPKYLSIDLNLPLEIKKEELKIMWNTIHSECEKMGIAIISGHTARYHGCNYPMVGGATVIAIGDENEYVTPKMAMTGDDIVVTKGAAIEATGLFGATFPDKIKKIFGNEVYRETEKMFYQMSVYEDAMIAKRTGLRDNGVTSMHDATEGGVLGGLYEVAKASQKGMYIEKGKIIVNDAARSICEYYKMDPYISISEGTMIMTVRPHKTAELISNLNDKGIMASCCGKVTQNDLIIKDGNNESPLEHPGIDPFWEAFARAFDP